MKNVIKFLAELNKNNNRLWFEANRPRYSQVMEEFNAFAVSLIDGISSFDPSVSGLTLKDVTYRIYRDTRFSKNKDPYKSWMGIYVCKGGKKSGYAGYYFHLEPVMEGSEGNLLTSGIYMPEPNVLRSLRDEIYDNGKGLMDAVAKAEGFTLDNANRLKKVPKGYPVDSEWSELLKQKDFYVVKHVNDKYMSSPDLLKRVVEEYSKTYELIEILNRAVDFALEEM